MQADYPLFYSLHFYLFGILAIASALAFVTRKSPVAAALWLVNVMFCLAALYVLLDAHFIGVIQVLVYAGAIMVVFLFVVMLLNLGHPSELADARGKGWKVAAAFLDSCSLRSSSFSCDRDPSARSPTAARRPSRSRRRPFPDRRCRRPVSSRRSRSHCLANISSRSR